MYVYSLTTDIYLTSNQYGMELIVEYEGLVFFSLSTIYWNDLLMWLEYRFDSLPKVLRDTYNQQAYLIN